VSIGEGDLEIDLAGRRVATPAGTHPLTPTEVRFVQVLLGSLDRTVPTETLLDRVWSEADGADSSYVWVTVRRLRRKLELDPDRPRFLLTERGIGYRLSSG
jgi:two-component system KDP operon response regulator KdpE